MSYALEFSDDAARAIRQADVWLQEVVYDELDAVAADPSGLKERGSRPGCVHDFVRSTHDRLYTTFMVVRPDPARRVLVVLKVATHVRSLPTTGPAAGPTPP